MDDVKGFKKGHGTSRIPKDANWDGVASPRSRGTLVQKLLGAQGMVKPWKTQESSFFEDEVKLS